jgi:HD-GYP domain-containing protein (c-di-GMP phosphodiesterase class II)
MTTALWSIAVKFHHYIPIALIGVGALIMLASILSYRANIRSSYHLFYRSSKNVYNLYKVHLVLMLFFLIGYLIVIYSILQQIPIIGVAFIGAIFFFGAVFVFLGIKLQSIMFYSINLHHDEIVHKNEQLDQTENVTIFALAYQAEMRDTGTGRHLKRTSQYLRILAEQIAKSPQYRKYLTSGYIADLLKSAPLHDIGKVGVPDSILKKEGKLSKEEFELIKNHCAMGASTLAIAESKLEFRSFLTMACTIARSHHEKWNGQGYPDGLQGDQIPLSARMMAIADVYDALRSERCYKKSFSHNKAVEIITAERGEHFDPKIVDAFMMVPQKVTAYPSDENEAFIFCVGSTISPLRMVWTA